jgi:hypothetical protein
MLSRRAFLGSALLVAGCDPVSVLRRVVLAGGGSSFTIPAPPTALTTAGHAGWTQKPKARALWYGDHSYLGYVASDGDIEVVVIPDSTGVGGTPIVLHSALQVDTHAAPALLVRSSDNKLLVVYCAHNGGTMYQRVSTTSLDTDPTLANGFAGEATAFSTTDMTYPMLFERTAEASSPIYCFYRSLASGTATLAYKKSTDGGVTWDAQHNVYASSGKRTYWDIALAPDGQRFDFVVTDTVGATDQLGDILHFYADDTGYHTSDGTLIDQGADPLPFAPASLTLVYDETEAGKAWSHDLYVGAGGMPVFLFGIADGWSPAGGTDTEYRVASWDGAAWDISTILASAGAGQFDPAYGCLDADDPTRAYVTRLIGGVWQVWRYTSADLATWDAGAAITNTADDNLYPVAVKDHPSAGLLVVWNNGEYVSATDYTQRLMGLRA